MLSLVSNWWLDLQLAAIIILYKCTKSVHDSSNFDLMIDTIIEGIY